MMIMSFVTNALGNNQTKGLNKNDRFRILYWSVGRTGIEVEKIDENNAFVTYGINITDEFNEDDAGTMVYCFELATGQLAEEPFLSYMNFEMDAILESSSVQDQLHYMEVLARSLKEKLP